MFNKFGEEEINNKVKKDKKDKAVNIDVNDNKQKSKGGCC